MKLTEKENLRLVHQRKIPEWIPQNFAAVQLFCPSCYQPHGAPWQGGTDLFGAKWIVESNAPTGAIPDPRFHIIPDVEDGILAAIREYNLAVLILTVLIMVSFMLKLSGQTVAYSIVNIVAGLCAPAVLWLAKRGTERWLQ